MKKSEPFNAVIYTEDIGVNKQRKVVVDTDTGEIVLEFFIDKPK